MNPFPPVNWPRFTLQVVMFALCLGSVWFFMHVKAEKEAYQTACARLARQEAQVMNARKMLQDYMEFKSRYMPCGESNNSMIWQDADIVFRDVDFDTLIRRIGIMYSDLDAIYGVYSLFFVTEFDYGQGSDGREEGAGRAGAPPGDSGKSPRKFVLKGRLLTPCMQR